jgi:hypothetical protein
MKRCILITLICILWTFDSFADYGKAYYCKATIRTSDTAITGYFRLPYEFLPDSVLMKLKSDREYFEKTIKSESYSNGIELLSFLVKYGFRTAENDTSYVLCKSQKSVLISIDKIEKVAYHDLIIFDSWGNGTATEIVTQDLEWLNASPISVVGDVSSECFHQYFILHQQHTPELDKIINELISIKDTTTLREEEWKNYLRREELRVQLNDFKVIWVTRHRC